MYDDVIFFDASEYTTSLRCTVQKTGKIGFSDYTQKKLGINEMMSIRIGIDGTKDSFKHLIMQLLRDVDPKAFKVNKSGNYYYINPKPLLDILGINYKKRNVLFEMVSVDEDKNIFKLVKKEGRANDEE